MTVFWGLFFLFVTLLGLYLMAMNPLKKKYESSEYVDIGAGAFLIAASLIYFVFAHIIPHYSDEDNLRPCGSRSAQAICYGLDVKTCSEAWHSFDQVCEEEVRPIRERRPSALLYPHIYKCHARKFDKITFYNRRKADTPFCREYFRKID